MLSTSLRLALIATLGAAAVSTDGTLKVLRHSPQNTGEATEDVTVTFDRPVAGGLDSTVDPRTIFRIAPRVLGKLEWRDPVTIRFHPRTLLPAGVTFTVTIANAFHAMDGSRLAAPYTFSFRVKGPRVLDAIPVNQWSNPRYLTPDTRFSLLVSAPADLSLLATLVSVDAGQCVADKRISLRPVRQRRIGRADDRWQYSGDWTPDSARDLRRVIELVPAEPLPSNCAATLSMPERVDSVTSARSWPFHTYGPITVDSVLCAYNTGRCPIGPATVYFGTPVRGAELLRHVHLAPGVTFNVSDTAQENATWSLEAELKPRTRYLVTVDSGLSDVFGQRLAARFTKSLATTSYTPQVQYPYGRMVVERAGPRTLAVQHVNVDSLTVTIVGVPDSLEARVLGNEGSWADVWEKLKEQATVALLPVRATPDVPKVSAVRIPALNAARAGAATLQMIRITSPATDTAADRYTPTAVIQLTDLAVHARIGAEQGVVWVTGVSDGLPRRGARVTLYDNEGKTRTTAMTDAQGVARLLGYAHDTTQAQSDEAECEYCDYSGFEGSVAAALGTDRAVVSVSRYDPDLSPWQFNVYAAWGPDRMEQASALFTERGIYRPGEPVYAKAIVRDGLLGDLRTPRGDSLRWVFTDRENSVVRDTTVPLSAFGTADQSFTIPADAPLGTYTVRVDRRRDGKWRSVATTTYRVAEYRPPEFLVSVAAGEQTPRFAGDSVTATVEARYLFGAPMGRAAITWFARQRTASPWEFEIPNTLGYTVGEQGWWWEEERDESSGSGAVFTNATDTLDAGGHLTLKAAAPAPPKGKPSWIAFEATVTDVNRQTVTAGASVLLHPASFYLGAKTLGTEYFWTAGKPRTVSVLAVTPEGARLSGIAIHGALIRREWHQVRREREGYDETVGEWVADTVDRCDVMSDAQPAACRFTPTAGGSYTIRFTTADDRGRPVATSFYRWVVGSDWVPWNDASQFKMDVVPDRTRYAVGDTATVLFASPFTNAEAWVTIEREGLIDQRRLRITSGTTILKLPITEAYVPNAFVSIIVARGRSAPPAAPDDPGRPTIRVGYAELRVLPAVKRLTVDVKPLAEEYRPGDSARIDVRVRDGRGAGRRSEVTLWAVDEGVLSLTGYKTPDPIDLLYQPRGLGLRLASTLTSVAAQVTEGEKGRAPGGGGGMDVEGILRSRFQTTAFFLGSVVTDSAGHAIAAAKLPDNLTTFRLMAVAVTAGDRYGSGDVKLLVSRRLVARPALPRFLREGDSLQAGIVVNSRLAGTPTVVVQARAQGATLLGPDSKSATLEAGRGREVRFTFRGAPGDTAAFQFKASSGDDADAVETRLPIRLPYHPRAFEVAGTLVDSASAQFVFPEPIDPDRSRLVLSYGASPLALIRGYRETLRIYPYECSEQIASVALPLIALYRAQLQLGGKPLVSGDPKREIQEAVALLSGRQRDDGAIGLWSKSDWSTPWLSAYAGRTLLAARAAGVAIDDSMIQRLATYLTNQLHDPKSLMVPVAHWYDDQKVWLGERVAAADFLSRAGRPDIAAENDLLQRAQMLSWEDRALLAEILARRRELVAARSLLAPAWAQVTVEGRRAVLPTDASAKYFYFWSTVRPAARLLTATLAVQPGHPLVGPLVEAVAQRGRSDSRWWWDTQDYASAVEALARYDTYRQRAAARALRVTRGGRVLFEKPAGGAFGDTTIALTGLVAARPDGTQSLQVSLASPGTGLPVFYYLTVREVPQARPVTPFDAGIKIERWYERYDTPAPITRAALGQLIRVKLRVTVPVLRNFIVVDDALPAGLEAVDLSLRTAGLPPVAEAQNPDEEQQEVAGAGAAGWYYGYWEYGWWSPWDHRELRDDRVVYVATTLWPGTYTMTYVARATTPGVFVRPPVHAEEMYNPGVNGRSDGGIFTVTLKP